MVLSLQVAEREQRMTENLPEGYEEGVKQQRNLYEVCSRRNRGLRTQHPDGMGTQEVDRIQWGTMRRIISLAVPRAMFERSGTMIRTESVPDWVCVMRFDWRCS